jgi:hypothetical protein
MMCVTGNGRLSVISCNRSVYPGQSSTSTEKYFLNQIGPENKSCKNGLTPIREYCGLMTQEACEPLNLMQ